MTKEQLKEKFENGDTPNGADYAQLIDSSYNTEEINFLTSKDEELTVLLNTVSDYRINNFFNKNEIPVFNDYLVSLKNYDDGDVVGDFLLVRKDSISGILGREFLKITKKIALYFYNEDLKISQLMSLEVSSDLEVSNYIIFKAIKGSGFSGMSAFATDVDGVYSRKCHIVPINNPITTSGGTFEVGNNELEIPNGANLIIINKTNGNYINVTDGNIDMNGANGLNLNSFSSDVNINANQKLNVNAGNIHFASNNDIYFGSTSGNVVIHSGSNDIQIVTKKITATDLTIQDIELAGSKSLVTLELLEERIANLKAELTTA